MKTAYGVFILESVDFDEFADGEHLEAVLEVTKIPVIHYHVESKAALATRLKEFEQSKFRYLFFSCHADQTGIYINGDKVLYKDLADGFEAEITGRRVFMSACKGANLTSASLFIGKAGAMSLIGPPIDIEFKKAAIFWPPFCP